MAKKKGNLYGKVISYEPVFHKTSIGKKPSLQKMNKHKRRMRGKKKNRGQGVKWQKDQCSIQMESLFHIKCHKIIDHHKVEVAVETVVYLAKNLCFVGCIELKELEILMFVINGEQDTLKDNGTNYIKWWSVVASSCH